MMEKWKRTFHEEKLINYIPSLLIVDLNVQIARENWTRGKGQKKEDRRKVSRYPPMERHNVPVFIVYKLYCPAIDSSKHNAVGERNE